MRTIDQHSTISRKLTIRCNGEIVASATGFLYESSGKHFLVSNWHVFSNKNNQTGHYIVKSAVPDILEFEIPVVGPSGEFSFNPRRIKLVDEDGSPLWIEMPINGMKYDIAAIEVNIGDHGAQISALNSDSSRYNYLARVASDVFILGFPKGLALDDKLPIWKRGSIATEMEIDYAGLPIFVVDSATRDGMSGSPVYWRSIGLNDPKTGSMRLDGQIYMSFLGVYSGRYHSSEAVKSEAVKENDAQLARVWRAHLVEELVKNGVRHK